MPRRETYDTLNKDDEYASRVFALALKFFTSARPISTSVIRSELYPGLDERSFLRQFLRDRNLLSSLGIFITEASDVDDSLWKIDEDASYVQGDGITVSDARILYVLCHDLVYDQSFPYRDELRVALVKIARFCRDITISQPASPMSYDRKILATLVNAMSSQQAVEVCYVDARGVASTRLLALLGSFGMRDHTYFVASRVERDGTLVPDSVRTYRLDRFERASLRASKCTYQIPLDFSVRDFEKLPFQIGDIIGQAVIQLGDQPAREVAKAIETSGQIDEDGNWNVPYSSVRAIGAWCLGNEVTPRAPQELVQAYRKIASATASSDPYEPSLASQGVAHTTRAPKGATGRTGGIAKVRQLITLTTSLTSEGDVISAQQIADALDVTYEQARHLIMLMTMSSGESFDYLPVSIDDEYQEMFLIEGARFSAPRIRLTRSETLALSAALAELGVSPDDALAKTLRDAYAAPTFSTDDLARSIEDPETDSDLAKRYFCSELIVNKQGLTFWYKPVAGGEGSQRKVVPQLVTHNDESWYLEAYDLVREARRVFRFDRMERLESIESVPHVPSIKDREQHARTVTVRFGDAFYLDLFHWEGIEPLSVDTRGTVARLPYYGGSWLARHLAACEGTVSVDDESIAREMIEIARRIQESAR